MTNEIEAILTKDHRRLVRVATAANILAWLLLCAYVLFAFVVFSGYYAQQSMAYWPNLLPGDVARRFIDMLSGVARRLICGVASWLTLRGVSLGLRMIVETDCNFRRQARGASHE